MEVKVDLLTRLSRDPLSDYTTHNGLIILMGLVLALLKIRSHVRLSTLQAKS